VELVSLLQSRFSALTQGGKTSSPIVENDEKKTRKKKNKTLKHQLNSISKLFLPSA